VLIYPPRMTLASVAKRMAYDNTMRNSSTGSKMEVTSVHCVTASLVLVPLTRVRQYLGRQRWPTRLRSQS
jgi:hypothetical protein